jgi:hypothetical protein
MKNKNCNNKAYISSLSNESNKPRINELTFIAINTK